MGVGYTIISLADLPPDARGDSFFTDAGITFPTAPVAARRPAPRDVRAAVARLSDCVASCRATPTSLDIDVTCPATGAWAAIWIQDYAGPSKEDQPCSLYVQKGWEDLVMRIVGELASVCGPFVVVINGEEPRLVSGSTKTAI